MSKNPLSKNSPAKNSPSKNIFGELDKLVGQAEKATSTLEACPDSCDAQCQICLLTRSVYTEFFSVSEFSGEIDDAYAQRLDQLFRRVLRVLPAGRYKKSVDDRFRDFVGFCHDVRNRQEEDTVVSI